VWQLDTLGLSTAYVAVLLPRLEFREYRIDYNADEAAYIRAEAAPSSTPCPVGRRAAARPRRARRQTYAAVQAAPPGDRRRVDVEVPDRLGREFCDAIRDCQAAKEPAAWPAPSWPTTWATPSAPSTCDGDTRPSSPTAAPRTAAPPTCRPPPSSAARSPRGDQQHDHHPGRRRRPRQQPRARWSPSTADDFATVLPTHVRPDTFVRVAQGALKRGKKQGNRFELEIAAGNNPGAFMAALLDAARLGLEPGTEQFYLTPRKVKGQLEILGIVGWQGYVELMYRAGAVSSVVAEVVHANDKFRFQPGRRRASRSTRSTGTPRTAARCGWPTPTPA
jgi:hypothetical protein